MDNDRLLMQAGLLLLVNLAALGCAACAFVVVGFMDNYVEAAFPALLAFLLSAWQPWLLLLCLIPYVNMAAPIVSVPITLFVYRTLFRMGKLQWLRSLSRRFAPRTLAAAAGGFLVFGGLVSYAGYRDIFVQHRGIPPTVLWHGDSLDAKPFLSNSRYYTLSHFLDQAYLWQVKVPRKQIGSLVDALGLKRVPAQTLPANFWQQPPFWWQRPANGYEEYTFGNFSEKGRLEGGSHAGAAYDPKTETLYVWETEIW